MKKTDRKIIFGLDIDGSPKDLGDSLFTSRMGPTGFLGFLETHCGIVSLQQSQIERIAAFMGILAENESVFPSYHESWLNAPLASAKRMLEWIDAWYLYGWDGSETAPAGTDGDVRRIRELMLIERESRSVVVPGTGQRLLGVARALLDGVHVPISCVEIVDDKEDWPVSWLRVFDTLPCNWRSWHIKDTSPQVSVVAFDSSVASARALGDPLFFGELSGKTCRLFEDDSSLRDEVLFDTGRPQTGTRGSVTAGPASQILPLALALYRDPPDMKDWLGFLSLPVCPLGNMRHALARSIAESGGINGEKWQEAIGAARSSWIDKGRTGESFDDFLTGWLPETRYSDKAFPRSVINEIANRVAKYLRSIDDGLDTDNSLQRISSFTRSIGLLGPLFETVNWSIIEDILSIVQSTGGADSGNRREAGSGPVWRMPGAMTEPCDTLVWYMPQTSIPVSIWPWSNDEKKFLSRSGCTFPDLAAMSSRPLKVLRRLISLVNKRIILALSSGHGAPSLAELVLSGNGGSTFEMIVSGEENILTGNARDTVLIKALPLPMLTRWWNIKMNLVPESGWNCSFTALDDFLGRPAKWLLKYKAGIRKGSALSLPDTSRFTGTCAHKMIEDFFATFKDDTLSKGTDEYHRWFDGAFPVVLEQLGFPFLSADAVHERIAFENRLRSSILSLCNFLRIIGARHIRFEERVTGEGFDASFKGYVDLIFENSEGRTGIIDMKYSPWLKIFRDKMKSDTDIQLTIYAELWRQTHGELPETAYWLFPKEKLIARNDAFYTGSVMVSSGSSHEDRFGMIAESVDWRKAQLAEGRIEVVCNMTDALVDAGTETGEESPEGGLPLGETNDGFDDYISLYGWSDMA